MQEFYSTHEAAQLLGLSEQAVVRLIRARRFRGTILNGNLLSQEAIDNFIGDKARRTRQTQPPMGDPPPPESGKQMRLFSNGETPEDIAKKMGD